MVIVMGNGRCGLKGEVEEQGEKMKVLLWWLRGQQRTTMTTVWENVQPTNLGRLMFLSSQLGIFRQEGSGKFI